MGLLSSMGSGSIGGSSGSSSGGVRSPIIRLSVVSPSTPTPLSPVSVVGPTPPTGAVGSPVTVTVKVVDPVSGVPVSGQSVSVAVTSGTQGASTLTTSASGEATYTFTPPRIGGYGFYAWVTMSGVTYTSNLYVYNAGFDTFTPSEEYVLPVIAFGNVYTSTGSYLGTILSYGGPQGTLTVRDASTNEVVSTYTLSTYYPGAVIYPGTGLPPGDYLFDFTDMTINHGGNIVKVADMTGLYMPLRRQGGIYAISLDVYVDSLPTPPQPTATVSVRYGLIQSGGNTPPWITQLLGGSTSTGSGSATASLYDSSGLVSTAPLTVSSSSVGVSFSGVATGKFYTVALDTYIPGSPGYYSTQIVAMYPPYGYVFDNAPALPRLSSFNWGASDSVYLFTGHWTNPAIIGKWGAVGEVTAHGYANIVGMTLTPTPSWGVTRVWYGEDGYLYAVGFGDPSGQAPGTPVYKLDPATLSPVWVAYVEGVGGGGFGYLNGELYIWGYNGDGAVINASTGSVETTFKGGLGGASPAGGVGDFQFNEFHTDGSHLWRLLQGGKVVSVDPATLQVTASSTGAYDTLCYDPSTNSLWAAYSGNCSSTNPYPNCYPVAVDRLDPATLQVTATWRCPFPVLGGARNMLPTAMWASDGYIFIGYYYFPLYLSSSGGSATGVPQRTVLNTSILDYARPPFSGAPVDVLRASDATYVGSLFVDFAAQNTASTQGENIRVIRGYNDGSIYILNDDANAAIVRFSTTTWNQTGLWLGPRWYENIVNTGTPAQPRPDGWEEIRDFTLSKPIIG